MIDAKTHNFSRAWEFDKKSGLAAVVEDGKINNKSGVIDANGKVCIEPKWDEVNCLNPSLFKVWLGNQKFLFDATGKYIN